MRASLTDRVRSGVALSAASAVLTQAVGLARSVVLARLLAPDDYGLFGMALTVSGALTVLTSFGLDFSLVARKFSGEGELEKHLDTVWTAELLRKLLLALLVLAAAYPTARFYGSAELLPVMLALAAAPLIQGFHNIGLVMQQKRVDFRRVVWLEQLTNLSSTLAAVGIALFWSRDVWALVLGQIASAVAGVALSYALDPYRPRPRLDRRALREALGFGKHVFVVGVAAYVTTTADNVVVGKSLGAAALGLYVLAYNLATIPVGVAARVGGTLIPAYVEAGAQERGGQQAGGQQVGERVERGFARAFAAAAALLAVVSALLLLLADEVVMLLYGAKWSGAAPALRVLSVVCFCRGLMQVAAPLVLSARGPAPEARAKVFESLFFLAILYPLTRAYGLVGAASAGALVYVPTLFVRLRLVRLVSRRAHAEAVGALVRSLAAGAVGTALGALALRLFDAPLPRAAAGASAATVTILLLLLATQPALRAEAADFAGWLLRPREPRRAP